jgi:hypothetical protein
VVAASCATHGTTRRLRWCYYNGSDNVNHHSVGFVTTDRADVDIGIRRCHHSDDVHVTGHRHRQPWCGRRNDFAVASIYGYNTDIAAATVHPFMAVVTSSIRTGPTTTTVVATPTIDTVIDLTLKHTFNAPTFSDLISNNADVCFIVDP